MSENEPGSVDRRMVFRNVQLLKLEERVANSPILQFISTNPNIGNYMPVRAIQDMLGEEADVWNLHRPADWDFINNNYKAIVIGGAGLLARPFNHFWVACAEQCKLPKRAGSFDQASRSDHRLRPRYSLPGIAW